MGGWLAGLVGTTLLTTLFSRLDEQDLTPYLADTENSNRQSKMASAPNLCPSFPILFAANCMSL
jgi:hypothetical protein